MFAKPNSTLQMLVPMYSECELLFAKNDVTQKDQ